MTTPDPTRPPPPAATSQAPTPLAIALTTTAGLILTLAVALSHPQLIVFAAPMIGIAALGWQPQSATITTHTAGAQAGQPLSLQCFESENIDIRIHFALDTPHSDTRLDALPSPVEGLRIDIRARTPSSLSIAITAHRWGRYTVPIELTAALGGGLVHLHSRTHVAHLLVYPSPTPTTATPAGSPAILRVGQHLARTRGSGTEFADIRAFAPGDSLRSVNWPATARRRSLQSTQRRHEHAADIVVVLESPAPEPEATDITIDRSVRGAAELTWSALRAGDRVGLVCLGDRPRWYATGGGRHQFYGVLSAMLDNEHHAAVSFEGTLPPPAALPRGATVVAFTDLLDAALVYSLLKLRKHGHRVLVIDVLPRIVLTEDPDSLTQRLWSFERAAMHRDMGAVGVEVLSSDDDTATVLPLLTARPGLSRWRQ